MWLAAFRDAGAWLVAHPISVRVCTAVGRGWAEAGQDVYGLCILRMDQLKFSGSLCHWSSEFWCVFWLLSFFARCNWV